MTPEERREQRISFAYGNVSMHNPDVTREMVERAASIYDAPEQSGWRTMTDKPICGGNCNQCNDCPDLHTTRDSKLYMRGFEDGRALEQSRLQSDRDALAAHWKD